MQHKQYQAHHQGNMNEGGRAVKCEKPKQPKNNQNHGDCREPAFYLLASERQNICNFLFFRNFADASSAGRTLLGCQMSRRENAKTNR
jgi:hypothetical protein